MNVTALCVFRNVFIYWVTVFVVSFRFLFCEISESGMEKAWQLLRLWTIKEIWQIYEYNVEICFYSGWKLGMKSGSRVIYRTVDEFTIIWKLLISLAAD